MHAPADSDPLYEDAACGLLVTDASGTILRANRTFAASLGKSQADIVGKRFQSLLTMGGRIFHQTHWSPLLKMQGSLGEVKLDLIHADGRKVPMVMNAAVRRIGEDEYTELAMFSARDRDKYEQELLASRRRAEAHLLTEQQSQRELAEARLRLELAIDAAQLFPWSVELPGRSRRYDRGVALLLGYGEPRDIDAAEFDRHIRPEDSAAMHAAIDAFLGAAQGRLSLVVRLRGTDGNERWVAASGRLRLDASGAPVDLVGFMQDVTDSQRQRELAEDRALLAEQTLGIVGHDLRNPLAAIQMGAEILGLRHLDAAQQEVLGKRIQSSTRRANRLIADLLDFTQARTGRRIQLKPTPIDGHAVVREVMSELAGLHPERVLQNASVGDAQLTADADRIAQALGNLVSNALAYGSQSEPIVVTSRGDAESVVFSVHNKGSEIPRALRATLFEPMTRGDSPGHLRSVGLGLYIVREIAIAHGGQVDVESSAAAGTTFTLTLPRGDEARAARRSS